MLRHEIHLFNPVKKNLHNNELSTLSFACKATLYSIQLVSDVGFEPTRSFQAYLFSFITCLTVNIATSVRDDK